MPDSDIVIDLNSSNHNRPVSSGAELIQREAFDALSLQISKDLAQAEFKASLEARQNNVEREDLYPHGSGLTYFIDGTRGAGKSTFLRFTYNYLNERPGVKKEGVAVSVTPLLYLDPSRIESGEILLLHILKHLKRLMENCPHRGQDWGRHQEQFRDLFKQMAGGLHLFVSKTDSLKDLDAELFLDYGLDRAADSQRLRHLLHQTIELVCSVYKTRAFLLAIDDADTKFAHAIDVLECIRKYLDTPQIVVLVTGDMEMYSLLVQNHFQQDFASNDKGFSPDRKTQQTRMVAHLEEQYLLKLFPIQRRVQLKTLHTLTERKRKDSKPGVPAGPPAFVVKRPGDGDAVPLLAAIDAIATAGLRLRDRLDLDLFREYVLKLPVRSVLQLLSSYYQFSAGGTASEREAASEALRATALSSLYRHDIDVESIAEGDLHAVINAAFDLCQLDGEPDTAIYLRPQSRDATLRNAYVSLAADVARLCEHDPAKAITYMVSMAGSNNILHLVMGKATQKPGGRGAGDARDESALQRKVKQYLSVGRKDNALNWSLHATAALMGASTTAGLQLRQGIIGVRTSSKSDAVTFDAKLVTALKLESTELYPAIAFSQSAVKKPSHTLRYLSIFNTLGLISNLLDIDATDTDGSRKQLFKQLNKIKSVQTVSLPNWDDLAARDDEADTEAGEAEYEDDDQPAELVKLVTQITSWLDICQGLKQHFHPSAVLMGKIWNRLYFSLDNISAAMRAGNQINERSCKAMELFAWALINACLVEEVDYHHRAGEPAGATLNRYNPRTSGALVIKKFQSPAKSASQASLDVTADMAPLAFMIASCPLVLGLIKHDAKSRPFIDSLNAKLTDFRGSHQIPHEVLCNQKVWDCVGQTTVSE
ncbi:hypothetical protein [Acidovorax sp. A1169]|uniref:hypothetical protein n=1 Tax=Acidovorax sp. A1169 TaxID=3059524 RepID=UPI0027378343|nr:hypothetical protein [Acidovorax sp. A1169]MDP4073879.1 hypothetical protein [Acidovorax sp. A1169]